LISVILPIRNEINFISNTLDSIINQDYPDGNLEIIIADGMSDDGTRGIIKDYIQINSNIQLINNPEKIVSTGFNRALSISEGDIIIRVDGHSEISQNFINNCLLEFENTEADCVGGSIDYISQKVIGKAIMLAQSSKFGVGGVAFREIAKNGKYVDTLAFGAYKREVFDKIGGYDEELVRNQDDEFNFRLIQNGGKIWLDPSIKSTYYPRNSLTKLFKQYFQYGFYKVRVMQKRKGFASWRHLVPVFFVLTFLVSIIYSLLSSKSGLFYLVSGSYLIANLFAMVWEIGKQFTNLESKSTNSQLLLTIPILPITFFTLHFSYGLGFLCGLVHFWNKWGDTGVKDYHFDRELFMKNSEEIRKRKNEISNSG